MRNATEEAPTRGVCSPTCGGFDECTPSPIHPTPVLLLQALHEALTPRPWSQNASLRYPGFARAVFFASVSFPGSQLPQSSKVGEGSYFRLWRPPCAAGRPRVFFSTALCYTHSVRGGMTMGTEPGYPVINRGAFVPPAVCASSSPVTTFKRCRQEQGTTSRQPGRGRMMMMLLPDAVGTFAARRLRPRAPSWSCGGEGSGGGGGGRGSEGERERDRMFMFLGRTQSMMAARRGSGSEAAAAAAAGAAADEHFVNAQQYFGRVAVAASAAHPPQPQDHAVQRGGSSKKPSVAGLVPPGSDRQQQRPNGGASSGGGRSQEHALSKVHAAGINGHSGRADGASNARHREASSRDCSSGEAGSETLLSVAAPSNTTSSGRARRQRLRRRRERATMAAKKSLVKKVRSKSSGSGLHGED